MLTSYLQELLIIHLFLQLLRVIQLIPLATKPFGLQRYRRSIPQVRDD